MEVAALAGVKRDVIRRAKEILAELESRDDEKPVQRPRSTNVQIEDDFQLMLDIEQEDPLVTEIKGLDLDSMSPMEALTKLYELKAKAKNG